MPGIYLSGAAMLTAIFAGLSLALPRRRPGAFVSAAALAPFGLLGYVFVPGYWRPDHLFQIVPGVGVEDFLICFSEGGIVWLLAGYGKRIDSTRAAASQSHVSAVARSFVRLALLCGTGGALAFAGSVAGLETMTAIVIGFSVVGIAIGALRVDLLPGALCAGPAFAAVHIGVGIAVVAIWPHAAEFWNPRVSTGARTFGLPIEELAWALAFGACWPMFVAVTLVQIAAFKPAAMRYRMGGPDCLQSGSTKTTRNATA